MAGLRDCEWLPSALDGKKTERPAEAIRLPTVARCLELNGSSSFCGLPVVGKDRRWRRIGGKESSASTSALPEIWTGMAEPLRKRLSGPFFKFCAPVQVPSLPGEHPARLDGADFAPVRLLMKEIPDAKCVVLPTAFWRTAPQSDRGDSETVHLVYELPR